jgi:hypothetical protein
MSCGNEQSKRSVERNLTNAPTCIHNFGNISHSIGQSLHLLTIDHNIRRFASSNDNGDILNETGD